MNFLKNSISRTLNSASGIFNISPKSTVHAVDPHIGREVYSI